MLGPFHERIVEFLTENEHLPRKQRYTARKIYQELEKLGYAGSEGSVRRYVAQKRREGQHHEAYLPLEFDPGQDAQLDWGEAVVVLAGEEIVVQLFVIRLNYSHARFAMAFPFQKQEAFLAGHIEAFHFFGGVPHHITYDNLKTAVVRILEGRDRQEQETFVAFRSHYLFESRYCTPAQGHEKGGVESDIGYVRRNFLVPIPQVHSFDELNQNLRQCCLQDAQRRLRGQSEAVALLWEAERARLLPCPAADYLACTSHPVKANPYSQVVFETNRYSVPTEYVGQLLVLRAYPFRIEVLSADTLIATHARCCGREEDVFDPLHYLGLLEQRPGAFAHAIPLRRWRVQWPSVYETLLRELQERWPEGRGLREFLRILQLHRQYRPEEVEGAVRMALELGAVHLDGVELCLRQQLTPQALPLPLDLSTLPRLQGIGEQPVDLKQYDSLLTGR